MGILRLPEVSLHVVRLGEQVTPPEDLVMVHGLAASLGFWYLRVAPELGRRHRVTLYDLRGHGKSSMPPRGYTPERMAEDLEQLLDGTGIESAHLVAHSFGGLVVLRFALRHPRRVRSLTLVDVRIPGLRAGPGRRLRARLERLEPGSALDEAGGGFGVRLLESMARLELEGLEGVEPELAELSPFRGHPAVARRWLELVERTGVREELEHLRGPEARELAALELPILGVYGQRSPAAPSARWLKRLWPRARFVVLPRAGHFFPLTRPAALIELLEGFLAGPAAPTGPPAPAPHDDARVPR